MATSLMGPLWLVESAFVAAPVPRPPQPTKATWTMSVPAAWTEGMTMLASADAAASRPVFWNNSRREEVGWIASLMVGLRLLVGRAPRSSERAPGCKAWKTGRRPRCDDLGCLQPMAAHTLLSRRTPPDPSS